MQEGYFPEEHDYLAAQRTAVWRELSKRTKVRVKGPDRVSFFHALISNDVQTLDEFSGAYGTLLTETGKIIADFHYYRLPESILVDISADLSPAFIEKLSGYIIMDDVELEDLSGRFAHFSVQGPEAPGFLREILEMEGPSEPYRVVAKGRDVEKLLWINRPELHKVGAEVVIAAGDADGLRRQFVEKGSEVGIVPLSETVYETVRLERGIPLFGVDFSQKNNPLEARLSNAYSLTKGCYVGQEVIARGTHIGGVANCLVKLVVSGAAALPGGAPVLSEEGREIGRITSSTWSPGLARTIAFAYVKRAFSMPGNALTVQGEASIASAAVVESFEI